MRLWNESSRYCHDVHPSVCLSVRPSGTGVHCYHTVLKTSFFSEQNAQSQSVKIWRVVCQEHAYFNYLAMLDLETAD